MVARDIALARAHRRPPARRARQHRAARSSWCARAQARGLRGHRRGRRRTTSRSTEEAVGDYDTNAKMNPPLRTAADVAALRAALADGTIDAIATDHAPHHRDEKDVEFDRGRHRHRRARDRAAARRWRWSRDGVLDLPTRWCAR